MTTAVCQRRLNCLATITNMQINENNEHNDVMGILHDVIAGDLENARRRLQHDVMAWNIRDENGMTPLMLAASLNRIDIADMLLTSKCDVNDVDLLGNTALHIAVDNGHVEIARALIKCGKVLFPYLIYNI